MVQETDHTRVSSIGGWGGAGGGGGGGGGSVRREVL